MSAKPVRAGGHHEDVHRVLIDMLALDGSPYEPYHESKVAKQIKNAVQAASDPGVRLVRWFDDAKKLQEIARRSRARGASTEIMAALRTDILGGEDRHLVHRIPLPSPSSGEETVFLFPGHRAIYEIRTLWGRRHCFITFIQCDQDSGAPQPSDQALMEEKLAASLPNEGKPPKPRPSRMRRRKPAV